MPISGLVITLSPHEEHASRALDRMEKDPRLEIGIRNGQRVAVVSDTPSPSEDRDLWDSLQGCDGVLQVAVVYIDFDSANDPAASGPPRSPSATEVFEP